MTIHTPPWCLPWSSDGELMRSDRQDLRIRLVVQVKGLAAALLAPMLQATEPAVALCTVMPAQAAPMA
jgi:hypothetical protein